MDWQVSITRYLIEGGLQGRKQSDLIKKAGGNIRDGEVVAFLKLLASEKKADLYVLPGQIKWWRATSGIQRLTQT